MHNGPTLIIYYRSNQPFYTRTAQHDEVPLSTPPTSGPSHSHTWPNTKPVGQIVERYCGLGPVQCSQQSVVRWECKVGLTVPPQPIGKLKLHQLYLSRSPERIYLLDNNELQNPTNISITCSASKLFSGKSEDRSGVHYSRPQPFTPCKASH